jgi:hypothetical protein
MDSDTIAKQRPNTSVGPIGDVEKASSEEIKLPNAEQLSEDDFHAPSRGRAIWERLSGAGVEMRGAEPVPVEKRTDTQYANIFFIFATSMTSLLP